MYICMTSHLSVCLLVGYNREPCKTDDPIEMLFGLQPCMVQRNRTLDGA